MVQRPDRTEDRCWAQRPHQHLAVGSLMASIRRLGSEAESGRSGRSGRRPMSEVRGLPEAKGDIWGLLEARTGIWRPQGAEADIWRSRGA